MMTESGRDDGCAIQYLLIEAGHPDGIDAPDLEDEVAPRFRPHPHAGGAGPGDAQRESGSGTTQRTRTQAKKDASTTWDTRAAV